MLLTRKSLHKTRDILFVFYCLSTLFRDVMNVLFIHLFLQSSPGKLSSPSKYVFDEVFSFHMQNSQISAIVCEKQIIIIYHRSACTFAENTRRCFFGVGNFQLFILCACSESFKKVNRKDNLWHFVCVLTA
jgi:hypothetical protein